MNSLTLFSMIAFMDQITDKPDWEHKIFDETIVGKWKAEVASAKESILSEKSVDWCIAELRHKANLYKEIGYVEAVDGVFKSDCAIPQDLKFALRKAVSPLENVPEDQKDWHPGSDGMVLDLVHPSMHPLVYGLSLVSDTPTLGLDDCLRQCGAGAKVTEVPQRGLRSSGEFEPAWSTKFQWIPCQIFCEPDGRSVRYGR